MKTKVAISIALMVTLFAAVVYVGAQPLDSTLDKVTDSALYDKGEDQAVYIIRLTDAPAASYDGSIDGYSATSPAILGEGKMSNTPDTIAYVGYLENRQTTFISNMNSTLGRNVDVTYTYQHAFNGMAAVMTSTEAKRVGMMDGVADVQREVIEHPMTDVGPEWIGASGIWDGSSTGITGTMGEGVVVAILDTGVNSTHPSFAAVGGDGYVHVNPLGSGNYIAGSYCASTPSFCNDKLIGAWDMVNDAADPNSPEDSDGHGSHTASTTAGNVVTATLVAPTASITQTISGVAPHANIIMYDVCVDGCPGAALLAAVNQVVVDSATLPNGIAAINYSISGGANPYYDSVELAFLAATNAGIYVSASAGNSGPQVGTVAHISPWVGTTGASTHNRALVEELTGMTSDAGSLANITGAGFTAGYGPAVIVHARDFDAYPDGDPEDGLCGTPFPANTWTNGEIVVCDRGVYGRVQKGSNVAAGGAAGYVLANMDDQGESTTADGHVIPAIHIGDTDGDALRAWLAAGTVHTATISGTTEDYNPANGDIMADFSSRGPAGALSVLKPDITAPGVSIWAAVADSGPGAEYAFYSGTSMSSPHHAGAAALMTALHPTWSPQQIKSALMTTSYDGNTLFKEDGVTPVDPFDLGSGRIALGGAGVAGLVLDETLANFQAANPVIGGDPSTLNIPNFYQEECLDECSWTRTVSSTLTTPMTWTASVDAPVGMSITVDPSSFVIAPFGTQQFTVTAVVTGTTPHTYTFGSLSLLSDGIPWASTDVYTGTNAGGISWDRPFSLGDGTSGSCSISGSGPVSGDVYTLNITTSGTYTITSIQDYDGYLHLYAGAFDPVDQCINLVALNDDWNGIGDSQIASIDLTSGTYYLITSGWGNGDEGVFTNTIDGTGVTFSTPAAHFPVVTYRTLIPPTIDVIHDVMSTTQDSGVVVTRSMTISNVGAVDADVLDWAVRDTALPGAMNAPLVDWADGFESYTVGSNINGQGGWVSWSGNDPDGAIVTNTVAYSGTNAIDIAGDSDLTHAYTGYDAGWWIYSAQTYIPSSFSGQSYFILMSGNQSGYAAEVNFDSASGLLVNDGASGGQMPFLTDQWVEISVEIDLNNDVVDFYYGGNLLYSGTWTAEMSGATLNIGMVDLYANGASSVFYDDVALYETVPDACDIANDLAWVSATPDSDSTAPGVGVAVNVDFDSTGLNMGLYEGTLCVESNDPVTPVWAIPVSMTVTSDPPAIVLDQTEFESVHMPNVPITHTLMISNTGGGNLVWDIFEDAGAGTLQLPIGVPLMEPVVATVGQQVTFGDFSLSTSGQADIVPTAVSVVSSPSATDMTITHSNSQAITPANSVSCNTNGIHADNSYIRKFDLTTFGITQDFAVSSIDIGVEVAASGTGSDQPVTVNLYTWDSADPFTFVNFTLIGTVDTVVADQTATVLNIPVTGTALAGSTLVVEFFTPDGQTDGHSFYAGSNADGQTDSTYLAATSCSITEPTDVASIGFPSMHLVMNVTGVELAPPACSVASDIAWVSTNPISGTVMPASATMVDITFDPTGMATGIYTGTLCLNSNDPVLPLATFPLTMTVASYGVDLSGNAAMSGAPGDVVTYTLTLTNTGNVSDDFTVVISDTWGATASPMTVTVAAGATGTFDVMVTIPANAVDADADVAGVTVTSVNDAMAMDTADLTTTAVVPTYYIYLPVILK